MIFKILVISRISRPAKHMNMHMIINIGMISGLLPVTGLPAPFISYGGSFFLTSSILVGLINNAINNHI